MIFCRGNRELGLKIGRKQADKSPFPSEVLAVMLDSAPPNLVTLSRRKKYPFHSNLESLRTKKLAAIVVSRQSLASR